MSNGKKIVVVDDDLKVIMLVEKALTPMGFRVLGAEDGNKALELVKKEKPALLITDILLPGIDGVELCKRLKNDPETVDIKVILVTGVFNEASFKLQMDCRCDGFIKKPIDSGELSRLVNKTLDHK